jgi:hypothetical protein
MHSLLVQLKVMHVIHFISRASILMDKEKKEKHQLKAKTEELR